METDVNVEMLNKIASFDNGLYFKPKESEQK